ncbi:MAG: hypothetical protein Q8R84_00710 [Candidatus Nitrotoga sp.]|nr:hypothetical protein [Candidatus Nitrotoga sp.]
MDIEDADDWHDSQGREFDMPCRPIKRACNVPNQYVYLPLKTLKKG